MPRKKACSIWARFAPPTPCTREAGRRVDAALNGQVERVPQDGHVDMHAAIVGGAHQERLAAHEHDGRVRKRAWGVPRARGDDDEILEAPRPMVGVRNRAGTGPDGERVWHVQRAERPQPDDVLATLIGPPAAVRSPEGGRRTRRPYR